ncbi:uncharacterized protein LOC142336763 [Convolutriloba macropyga]|uniref:uncharacterized protein LOC142336763 n=1 Tax=Convolutriloba macropyga TaxID=536237 RepID=UPI003F5230AF
MQCENVTEPDFHSVSTCTEVPDSMKWAPGRPDERGDYEFCVEYIRGYGMNDVRCESSFVKWIVCQYTRNCPSDFEMANGISDKCFMVQSAHGHKGAKKAKEFCEARNAILYEPKSRDELLRLENHFTQLKTRVYFVGYVEQRSGLGCENKGDFVYHGISSCTDAPKGLFFEKEPNNCEGLGEWCVVSREHGDTKCRSTPPELVQSSEVSTVHSVVNICVSSATCVALHNFLSKPPVFNSIKRQASNISVLLALTPPPKLLAILVTLSQAT